MLVQNTENKSTDTPDHFVQVMTDFLSINEARLHSLKTEYDQTVEELRNTSAFFSEGKSNDDISKMMNVWKDFIDIFERSMERNWKERRKNQELLKRARLSG